ncbi:hypothetical protein BFP70_19080 [Thioclava sp. SK-1]|uniref:DUF1028 domain-containing protein n=1 Tax=Thioclava sp. SK-1 TaxID=1889770 RepID=UPI000825815C|nr:DUF1028 domain-containing protein [Thioclava sp. SK-1]OCX58163.1 hypothetical protein BFP70_19080 [Thioclava sp. SK-1]
MTFSIIGHCPRTGAFGAAIATSDLAVGNRCVRLAHGRGAMLSQHRTDSRLGDLGIAALQEGQSADDAVTHVISSSPDIEWRQLGALDHTGRSAVFHGRRMYSIYTHSTGKNCLALGNILDNEHVTDAMANAFQQQPNQPLAERLLQALEAGLAAGGEVLGTLKSAALQVTGDHGIAAVDLRVDISDGRAVPDLRHLFDAYKGREAGLRAVALEPDSVPVQAKLFNASIQRIAQLGLETRFPTATHRDSWTVAD